MRKSLILAVPLLALGLASCGGSGETPDAAASGAATAAATASASAAAPVSAEEAKKIAAERHESFETIGKAYKVINDQLKASSPDKARIQEAAATINEMAPKVASWFPAGSGPDVAPKTEALPAIWEKPAEFSAAAQKFVDQAGSFQRTVQATDGPALAAAAKALGGSCKGCHDQFRKPE